MHTATRYHDISCGHRVVGHEGKCKNFHGHNYRVHFFVRAQTRGPNGEYLPVVVQKDVDLDKIGRVVDFSVIKEKLCMWIEKVFDHKFLIWSQDPNASLIHSLNPDGVVILPFNPTAENIARYLVVSVGPKELEGLGVELFKVTIEETAKCSASYEMDP